jgi:hypothetical protein
METVIEEFSHGGEHLDNDERQAKITLWLLGIFAVAMAIVMVLALPAV